MAYQPFTLSPAMKPHEWPLRVSRGVFSEVVEPGQSAIRFNGLHDYFLRHPEDRITYAISNAALHANHGMAKHRAPDSSQKLDDLIVATYHEGVELYRVLGQDFTRIKLASANGATEAALRQRFARHDAATLDPEHETIYRQKIERDGGTFKRREMPKPYSMNEEHLAGCLHALELLQAIRAQSSAALLAEEGVMAPAEYAQLIDQSHAYLAAQGHMGVYAMAQAHPNIEAALKTDKRSITVLCSRGREAFPDIISTSRFTRQAYFGSEADYLDENRWQKPEEYLAANTYPQAMGEWYIKAAQAKQAALATASQTHVLADHDMHLQTLTELPPYSSTDSMEYDHFKRQSARYVAKHGLALMQPEIVAALEQHGKFTPMNSHAIDHAFHHGYGTPYLPHIRELAQRLNGVGKSGDAPGGPPTQALPAPDAPKRPWLGRMLEHKGKDKPVGGLG